MKSIAAYLCLALLTPGLFISLASAQQTTAASGDALADNTIGPVQITLEEVLVRVERDPRMYLRARQLAAQLELPISILLPSNILMFPVAVEQNKPLYAIITNIAHPFEGGDMQFFEEITRRYDLSGAKTMFAQTNRAPSRQSTSRGLTNLLLVPDWTADRVWAFDPVTGNVVDTAFIHSNSTALASPKQALEHPVHRFITVSDQITDLVQKFNPEDGSWLSWFAPSGGVNTGILDNIRGHAYRPNNNLIVTVASGANQHTIAEFDTGGNYIGNFINAGVGGLNGPFDILRRENDILISQSSSPAGVKQYDVNGGYVGQWASITSFPQQMHRMADGRIAVANFSGTGQTGIRIYDANGSFLRLLSGVTGNRGVYQLPNGNFLTTNGAGIHEIDSTTGNLVRTIETGTNFQYINLYSPSAVGVGEESENLPGHFALEQNYPNPFNPNTTITYGVDRRESIVLRVYDILGREVATLVNEVKAPGSYEAMWDATGFASGVYFYRMHAGNFISTRKMALIR